jgi:hypothetical protein
MYKDPLDDRETRRRRNTKQINRGVPAKIGGGNTTGYDVNIHYAKTA